MKNLSAAVLMIVATVITVPARADHKLDPKKCMSAAHQLDERAQQFYEITMNMSECSRIGAAARGLGQSAKHLHEMIERGTSHEHVVQDFLRMRTDFLNTRAAFRKDHSSHHDWRVRYYWYRVEFMFQRLEWEVTGGLINADEPPHRH